MEDLDRVAIALDPAVDGLYQPARCGNMRADQHRSPRFLHRERDLPHSSWARGLAPIWGLRQPGQRAIGFCPPIPASLVRDNNARNLGISSRASLTRDSARGRCRRRTWKRSNAQAERAESTRRRALARFKNGEITRYRVYFDHSEALEAVGLSE